jgi:hypothetical protein
LELQHKRDLGLSRSVTSMLSLATSLDLSRLDAFETSSRCKCFSVIRLSLALHMFHGFDTLGDTRGEKVLHDL